MLCWLLLGVRSAAAASAPPDPLRAEPVAADEPSNVLGSDFTFVAPGMFDKPLALMDAPDGQHGRALSECVSAGSRTLRLPLQCLDEVTIALDSRCGHRLDRSGAGLRTHLPLERAPAHFIASMKSPRGSTPASTRQFLDLAVWSTHLSHLNPLQPTSTPQ